MKKRIRALLLAGAMLCTLAACGMGHQNFPSPDASLSPNRFSPGVYTGQGQGFGGTIKVEVTVSADRIEKVEVVENSETPGIGSKAVDALPDAIVEAQSTQVDVIGGATLASQGIIDAVSDALESAAAGASASAPRSDATPPAGSEPSTPTSERPVSTSGPDGDSQVLEADVVVVGAGGAGMTAGIAAALAGKQVIILEKTAVAGGNFARAAGGMNAAGTEFQNDNGWLEEAEVEKALKDASAYPQLSDLADSVRKEYDRWLDSGAKGYFDCAELFALDTMLGGKNSNDPELVATLAEHSADAIRWLDDRGISLHNVGTLGGVSVRRCHRPVSEKGRLLPLGSYIVPLLEQSCIDNGIRILYNTPVTQLLMEDGRITGVQAEGRTVNAGAVILATGGFGANPEMVTRLNPSLESFPSTNVPGTTGDGIVMAETVGAATVDMEEIQTYPTVEAKTSALISEGLRGEGAILVNAEGLRFCNELSPRNAVSAAMQEQTGGYGWLIMDRRMAENYDIISGYIESGYTLQGSTYAGLAKAMGVPEPAFSETMEKWNSAVAAGNDTEFGHTGFASALDAPPFYAIQVVSGIHHTMGGVRINSSAQVLDKDGDPISGLFAAGEVTGGVHGANCLGGNSATDCVVFGRIAGEEAAGYLNEQ